MAGADFRELYALAGRTALVTGASRGIGAAIARILGQMGADVAVNHLADGEAAAAGRRRAARDGPPRGKLRRRRRAQGHRRRRWWRRSSRELGPIDVLVVSAARSIHATLEDGARRRRRRADRDELQGDGAPAQRRRAGDGASADSGAS